MYDELISNLRVCSRCDFGQNCGRCTLKSSEENTFCCDILLHQAADAIEALSASTDMAFVEEDGRMVIKFLPRWIPVTERLPENIDDEVLVCTEDYGKSDLGFVTVAIYDGSGWLECWERKTYLTAVTHWMPLPRPPVEE